MLTDGQTASIHKPELLCNPANKTLSNCTKTRGNKNVTLTVPNGYQNGTKAVRKRHQNATETEPERYQNSTKTVSKRVHC